MFTVMNIKPLYYLQEAITSLRRNLLASIIAITTVAISLVVLGSFIIMATYMNDQIRQVENIVELTVDLKDTASNDQILQLQSQVQAMPLVKEVNYISKEEALDRLKKQFKNQPDIVEQLQGNPLPASLEIRLKDPKKVTVLAEDLENKYKEVIDEIRFGKDYVGRLFAVTKVIRWIGMAFIIMLWITSMVVIANTIRLAIFARRKEIGIMKLVGATNWFIRWPFLVEGVIQGILGVVLALFILWGFNTFVLKNLLESVRWLKFDTSIMSVSQLTFILSMAGMAIGAFGSMVALRRFLRV